VTKSPETHETFRALESAAAVREGVRLGVHAALAEEVDRTNAATAMRLVGAGVLGLASASAAVALFSRGSPEHVDRLHLAVCAAVWSSVLVIAFAFVLLRVGSKRLPVAEAAALALVGLGLAALFGAAGPRPQMLMWWMDTPVGHAAAASLGVDASTLCFGVCLSLLAGAGATVVFALRGLPLPRLPLSALLLFVLVWPVVAVQSLGSSLATLASWSIGLALGSGMGLVIARALAALAMHAVRRALR